MRPFIQSIRSSRNCTDQICENKQKLFLYANPTIFEKIEHHFLTFLEIKIYHINIDIHTHSFQNILLCNSLTLFEMITFLTF